MEPVIFTSCNGRYAQRFLPTFAISSREAGFTNKFIIDIVQSNYEKAHKIIDKVQSNFNNFDIIQDSEDYPLVLDEWPNKKTYFACRRYLILPEVISKYKKVWVTDIDVVFLKPFPKINKSLAYAISDNPVNEKRADYHRRKEGTIIKADMIYVDENFYDSAVKIRDHILTGKREWFSDQQALYNVIKDYADYENIPRTSPKRSMLEKWDNTSYMISPGGMTKKRTEFTEELNRYKEKFSELVNNNNVV